MNRQSIHFRLILWYGSLTLLVSLVFSAYIYQGVSARLHEEMQQTLNRRAERIANNIIPHLKDSSPTRIAANIRDVYSPESSDRFIRIIGPDRTIVYLSGAPKDGQFNPAAIPVTSAAPPPHRVERLPQKLDMLIVAVPSTVGNKTYYVEMGAPTDSIDAALRSVISTLLFGLPFIVVIAAAGIYVVVRYSLRPVDHIRTRAEQITFGNLSNRLPVLHTGDELETLSKTLNRMLDRLDGAYQQSMRFSADASHELRTPLSFMLGELETMVEDAQFPEHYRSRIGNIFEETERLSRITESLLALSRLDAGEAKAQHVNFDLAALAQSTVEQMLALAEEKNIQIAWLAPHAVMVCGDPARMKQVVINLLDNAIKYTPEGAKVEIRVYTLLQKAVLEVSDNGVGIAANALPHIFERFYRADKVRSRDLGGAGLGLPIVRSICQAHTGKVSVASIEGQGTTFRVELPLAEHEHQEEKALCA